jgi:hypothetical protein
MNKIVEEKMREKKYDSHIPKAIVYTTSKGGRYVRPFDILRSESGRDVINRFAEDDSEGFPSKTKVASKNEKRLPGGGSDK